jgi:hypothetical protein
VKIELHEDIAAPADFVFGRLTDFARHERLALRRGAGVKRVDGTGQPGVGAIWDINFDYRGKPRDLRAEITGWKEPEQVKIDTQSGGLNSTSVIDVIALSRTQTRINVSIRLEPTTLTARLLVQSLKLARGSVTGRLHRRLQELGEEMTNAWAKQGRG